MASASAPTLLDPALLELPFCLPSVTNSNAEVSLMLSTFLQWAAVSVDTHNCSESNMSVRP
ncbi:hypothetical protein ACRRTK_012020 [Alexandromys fortis]